MPKRFSGHAVTCFRGERFVFESLDFAVGAGQTLVLTGPNGCGKSSLMRIMAGLLAPADGYLAWDEEPVSEAPEDHRGRLHYVAFQDAIKPVLTVRENLSFWAGLKGPLDRVDGALERVGLAALSGMPAQFLSSGQRRRLSLARLAASAADLWLLDEPTVGLDRKAIGILETMIAEHRAGGGLTVIATHQPIELGGDAQNMDLSNFVARRQMFDDAWAGP